MSPLLKNLALILASTALSLGVIETAIRRNWIPEPAFVDAEGWWRENWLRHRRGPNPRHFVKLDTDLGWIPTPDMRDEPYQEATISTNSLGMRGTRELALERGAAPRIVALGDSFTFGQCANDSETWPAQLERMLASEVLNLGVMGYGHDQALLRLRRDGLPYRPDAVVLGFHMMDMSRNRLRFRDYSKPRFRIDGDELEVENVPVPDPATFDSFFYPRLLNFVSITVDRIFEERAYDQGRDLTREILRHMARETHAAGARFLLLWLPRQKDVEEGKDALPGPVRDACEEDGILCASPTGRIREALEGKPLRRHFKCHYSPLVYRLVAEEAARVLHRSLPERFPRPDLSGPPPAPPR